MITIKSDKLAYGINFPTSLNELTPEVLKGISEDIKLPKHYCIVALAFKTKIFDFVASMTAKQKTSLGVTPILCKISDEDSKAINAEVGDKIIMDRSSLERGSHLNINISINSNAARNYFEKDKDLVKSILTSTTTSIDVTQNIIILEFKICPVNDINAAIPMNYATIDPFIINDTKLN